MCVCVCACTCICVCVCVISLRSSLHEQVQQQEPDTLVCVCLSRSAELIEFHETKLSNKYVTLSRDLASKFKEVQDDKAMTLHDILEQMER